MSNIDTIEKSTISTGHCGEFFAAAELERRGYSVGLLGANTPYFDILAINRKTKKQIAIQVKTNKGYKKKWRLGIKDETEKGENCFYIFVTLNGLGTPEYHIVPNKTVAKTIKINHINWLQTPGKRVKKHKDTTLREFEDFDDKYLNRWELLECN